MASYEAGDKSTNKGKAGASSDEKVLELARERFRRCVEAERELRAKQLEDKKFAAGDHWHAADKANREADRRPCLVIDRLSPQIKQVTNQQRNMRPAVQVDAADGGDPDTAEVFQGIVRHIENRSDADDAYDQAGRDQAEIGRGYFRVLTAYVNDEGFDQEIRIKRIRNPFTVYFDPAATERDYSDARFCFVVEDVPIEEFPERFPKAKRVSLEEFESLGDDAPDWMTEGKVRIAEYWCVESEAVAVTAPDGRTRTANRKRIVQKLISGLEVLEVNDWPGKYIPIVPVLGEETEIEGKVDLQGMVRRAKDPQRMLNYWKSATTETMALAPKAPFVAAEGQTEPYKKQWQDANVRNQPVLIYKPTTIGGAPLPPPQRQVSEPPIQAMLMSSQGAENDLRAVLSNYDVGEQERREVSGKAILARKAQGEHGNSDYLDGLARAIRHAGRILIDLIPHIYDAPRVMRITGKDNQKKAVMVHAGNGPAVPPELPEGVKGVYDLSAGTYDVTVTVGPSMQSARQEFAEQMAQIFQGNPQLWQVVGDLFFENLDIPNARQIAERLRKMLPPQLQDEEGQQDPAVLQGQLQQAGQQIEQMGAAMQELQQKLDAKALEVESRERIAVAELEQKKQIEAMRLEFERAKAAIDIQLAEMKLQHEAQKMALQVEGQRRAQEAEHAHAAGMAERSALEARMSQRAEHDHAESQAAMKAAGNGSNE
jgi:hypothetical protein